MAVNHQVILAEKPRGKLALENFRLAEADIPSPADGDGPFSYSVYHSSQNQRHVSDGIVRPKVADA